MNKFYDNINIEEFKRFQEDLQMSESEIIEECNKHEPFCKSVARNISKNASRQGKIDETLVLSTCNSISSIFGVNIEILKPNDSVPTKDGKLLCRKEIKKNRIDKQDCLKSHDGIITGDKCKGFINAKTTFTNGGHQDNVFAELNAYGDWVNKFGEKEKLYVILLDTDLEKEFKTLKEKYHKNNILVVNHYEFQNYLIEKYS